MNKESYNNHKLLLDNQQSKKELYMFNNKLKNNLLVIYINQKDKLFTDQEKNKVKMVLIMMIKKERDVVLHAVYH